MNCDDDDDDDEIIPIKEEPKKRKQQHNNNYYYNNKKIKSSTPIVSVTSSGRICTTPLKHYENEELKVTKNETNIVTPSYVYKLDPHHLQDIGNEMDKSNKLNKQKKEEKEEEKKKKLLNQPLGGRNTIKRKNQLREHIKRKNNELDDDLFNDIQKKRLSVDINNVFSPPVKTTTCNPHVCDSDDNRSSETPLIFRKPNMNETDKYIHKATAKKT